MLKNLILLFVAGLIGIFSIETASAQSMSLDIRNQRYSGDSMFFDIYLTKTAGGNVYLGDADFALTFNHANFSSPTLNYVSGSTVFKNSNATTTTSYNANIATTIGTSGANSNKLVINVLQPTFSNQTTFNSNIAVIDGTAETHRLGTFFVKGLVSSADTSKLQWVTSGGTVTKIFTLANSTPWKSTRVSNGNIQFNNPTIGASPSTQVTAMTVTGKTDTTMTVSWTRGNGSKVIVLAKQGSAVSSSLPADGISYTDNLTFQNGSQIGTSGAYVVYSNTGTSATILGLTPNTTYHFAAVEFNGSGGYSENYYLTTPATTSGTTNFGEPDNQPTAFTFTSYGVNQLAVSMTAGDGASRIILVKEGSAVDGVPVDASSYTGDTVFESGSQIGSGNYVVYSGSGTAANISNLDPNKIYHFAVFEYNGTGGTENYLTTGPLTGDRSTLAPEPTSSASASPATSISTTSMTINFGAGNGNRRIVIIRSGSAVNSYPTDGIGYSASSTFGLGDDFGSNNYLAYDGTGSSVTVTGLDPNTTYYYSILEFNGQGDSANYKLSAPATGSQVTYQNAPTVASSNFTIPDFTPSTLFLDFTAGNGAHRIVVASVNDTPSFVPTNGQNYYANKAYGSGDSLGNGDYIVYKGDDDSLTVTGLNAATRYYFKVYEFNGDTASGAENYLVTPSLMGDRYTLQTPPTTASTGGSYSGLNPTSLTFSWNKGNGGTQIVFVKKGSAVSAAPVSGTSYSTSTVFGSGDSIATGTYGVYLGTDTFVTVTGLDANTTYYFEVFEVNGSLTTSNYLTSPTLTGNQTTLQDAPTVQASNLIISNVTTSSMDLSWTSGNGANRVVVAKAVSSVNGAPVDGITYNASSTFKSGDITSGSNYVVYKGSGSSVSVSGLSQDTVYYFAVYEFNGATGAENFLTTSPATGSENTDLSLRVTALLEGPFNGYTLDSTLNVNGDLPLSQPYSGAPWNYAGSETVGSIPNANVVDWVYVELRKAASPANALSGNIQDVQVGFILSDGSIVGLNGSSALLFEPDTAGYGQLYVVVYHRNHVSVMSASALTYNTGQGVFTYDFTTATTQAYGTDALVSVNGKAVMYAGNAHPTSSVIGANDRSDAWDASKLLLTGYVITDVNLDGVVDAADRSIIYNNSGQDKQVP